MNTQTTQTPVGLPIVAYEGQRWYFDARLRQIRNVENPHDYEDLDDFELAYFTDLVK
jgi:hypothetical protein